MTIFEISTVIVAMAALLVSIIAVVFTGIQTRRSTDYT